MRSELSGTLDLLRFELMIVIDSTFQQPLSVLLLTQFNEPSAQLPVHRFGPYDGVRRGRPAARIEHERVALAAAHAAMGTDQLLEGRHLVILLPVGAVQHDVRAMLEAVCTP